MENPFLDDYELLGHCYKRLMARSWVEGVGRIQHDPTYPKHAILWYETLLIILEVMHGFVHQHYGCFGGL